MRNWSFATNPFVSVTENSYYNALELGTFHDNALQAAKTDTGIATMYSSFHPIFLSFKTNYISWVTQGGTQQGETLNLVHLLEALSSEKIKRWDISIQVVYDSASVKYKKLLPNKRSPFQKGTQLERIHAIQALSKAIGTDTALAALKTDIDAFLVLIDSAYNTQKGSINSTKSASSNLEISCTALCNAMYANLGALIQKYSTTPFKIELFFDMKIMRRVMQTLFTGHIEPLAIVNVFKHTFYDDDEVLLKNLGTATLQVYLAASKDAHPTATAYKLTPGDHTIQAKLLGNLDNAYLNIFNPDTNLKFGYEVKIL